MTGEWGRDTGTWREGSNGYRYKGIGPPPALGWVLESPGRRKSRTDHFHRQVEKVGDPVLGSLP